MAKSRVGKQLAAMWTQVQRPKSSRNTGIMVRSGLMRPARGKPAKRNSRTKALLANKSGKRGLKRLAELWKGP